MLKAGQRIGAYFELHHEPNVLRHRKPQRTRQPRHSAEHRCARGHRSEQHKRGARRRSGNQSRIVFGPLRARLAGRLLRLCCRRVIVAPAPACARVWHVVVAPLAKRPAQPPRALLVERIDNRGARVITIGPRQMTQSLGRLWLATATGGGAVLAEAIRAIDHGAVCGGVSAALHVERVRREAVITDEQWQRLYGDAILGTQSPARTKLATR